MNLSVVCPAYNEGGHIFRLLQEWCRFLEGRPGLAFEIVVCDDGSRDQTWSEIQKLAARIPQIRGIRLEENQGAGFALATAIRQSRGSYVATTDADGQFRIEDVYRLYQVVLQNPGLDAACGLRRNKAASWGSRLGTRLSNLLSRLLFGGPIHDFNCALKVVRGDLLRRFPLEARGLNYSTELSYLLTLTGARVVSVPVEQDLRVSGKSSVRFFQTSRDRLLFLRYLWLKRRLIDRKVLVTPSRDAPGSLQGDEDAETPGRARRAAGSRPEPEEKRAEPQRGQG